MTLQRLNLAGRRLAITIRIYSSSITAFQEPPGERYCLNIAASKATSIRIRGSRSREWGRQLVGHPALQGISGPH